MLEEANHASFKSFEIPRGFLHVLNKWRRISGSSPDISPLRGSTGYVRASKDADNEYWLVPENKKVGSGSGQKVVFCEICRTCYPSSASFAARISKFSSVQDSTEHKGIAPGGNSTPSNWPMPSRCYFGIQQGFGEIRNKLSFPE